MFGLTTIKKLNSIPPHQTPTAPTELHLEALAECVMAALLSSESGCTVNVLYGQKLPYSTGYVVSTEPGLTKKVKHLTQRVISLFVKENWSVLTRHEGYLGIWLDDEKMYHLDFSRWIADRREAVEAGIIANQRAIWDVANKNILWLLK